MPHADQATIDLLTRYFAAMEAKDLPRLGEYYAEDVGDPSERIAKRGT